MNRLLISVIIMTLCVGMTFAMSIPEEPGVVDIQTPKNFSSNILLRLGNGQTLTATVTPGERAKLRNAHMKRGDALTLIAAPGRVAW